MIRAPGHRLCIHGNSVRKLSFAEMKSLSNVMRISLALLQDTSEWSIEHRNLRQSLVPPTRSDTINTAHLLVKCAPKPKRIIFSSGTPRLAGLRHRSSRTLLQRTYWSISDAVAAAVDARCRAVRRTSESCAWSFPADVISTSSIRRFDGRTVGRTNGYEVTSRGVGHTVSGRQKVDEEFVDRRLLLAPSILVTCRWHHDDVTMLNRTLWRI